MQLNISNDAVEVRLARWEKVFGLMKDIRVARADIRGVLVVESPISEAMRAGIKVGLRVPWVLFVARTLRLDRAFIVRRGAPGLELTIANHAPLERVLLSTPRAAELARELGGL